MPTTVVKTIRASGGDYTTLTAWEAANQGNLVTADEIRVAECYNDWPSGLDDKLVIDGSTTDATRYLMITVAAGHRHAGTPQSGFYLKKNVGFDTLLRDSDPYTRLEWLDIENTNSNGQALFANAGSGTYSSLIAKTVGAAQYAVGLYANGITVHGTLAYGSGTGFQINTSVAANIYNSVAAGCSKGFNTSSANAVLKNCVAYNNTTNYSGTFHADSTNNATSSASDDAPGDSSVVGITSADFANAASNDFHLTVGSALIGAGVNLYADLQTDVDGDAWPGSGAWDIGFDRYVSSGGAGLAAAAQAQAAAAGALTHSVPLAAAGLAVATSSGAMSVGILLAGAAAAQSGAPGTLSVTGNAGLIGAATATANASGGLALSIPLSAAAVSQALAAAGIAHGVPLAGYAVAGRSAARPDGIVDNQGGWQSSGGSLFGAINEAEPDDASYIYGTGKTVLSLSDVPDPGADTGHQLRFRTWCPTGSGWLSYSVYQGGTLIAGGSQVAAITPSPATYELALTPAEAAAITDYSALQVELWSIVSGPVYVSWLEFLVHDGTTGTLSAGKPLAGAAQAQSGAAAALTLNVSLAGTAIAQAAASAGITAVSASSLAGNAAAQASASGAVSHGVPLSGAALTVSGSSGNITQIVPIQSAAASASLATGGLDVAVRLDTAALAQALASATLTTHGNTRLAGGAGGEAAALATLTLRMELDGAALAQAVAAGALSAQGFMAAATPGYKVTRAARSYKVSNNRLPYKITRTPRTWRIAA